MISTARQRQYLKALGGKETVPGSFAALLFSASFFTTSGPAASTLIVETSTATAASDAVGAEVAWEGTEKAADAVEVLGPAVEVGW